MYAGKKRTWAPIIQSGVNAALGIAGREAKKYVKKKLKDSFKAAKRKRSGTRSLLKITKRMKRMSKQLKNQKCKLDQSTGVSYTYVRDTDRNIVGSDPTSVAWKNISMGVTKIEAALANLQFFDPSNPGTLITASGATATYQRQYCIDRIASTLLIRNNYQVPVEVKVYLCKVSEDTDITAYDAMANGIQDDPGDITVNHFCCVPSMSDQFLELWKVARSYSFTLQAGQQKTMRHYTKMFEYDPSVVDTHNLEFQRDYQGFCWLFRTEGVLGHDSSVTTEQGRCYSGVDYEHTYSTKITYDAGVNIIGRHVDDNSALSFTNTPVVGERPIADNQSLSVA